MLHHRWNLGSYAFGRPHRDGQRQTPHEEDTLGVVSSSMYPFKLLGIDDLQWYRRILHGVLHDMLVVSGGMPHSLLMAGTGG